MSLFGFSKATNRSTKITVEPIDPFPKISAILNKHADVLIEKRRHLIFKNEYGVYEVDKWNKELNKFFKMLVVPSLSEAEAEFVRLLGKERVLNKIEAAFENQQLIHRRLHGEKDANRQPLHTTPMTPIEFEAFCAKSIEQFGWKAETTKGSGDQGADVIANKSGKILVIQCKQYSSSIGNAAVQEVIAAKGYYRADYAAVITNSTYTKSANELAIRTSVILLSHDEIESIDRRISLLR
jgi:hypothetical protein